MTTTETRFVIGIDPGQKGAIALTNGVDFLRIFQMPLMHGTKQIHFTVLRNLLKDHLGVMSNPVILERAIPMAQGSKGAFTSGVGYERIVRAIDASGLAWRDILVVEPSKWTKEMHQGISKDLKPKAKSLLAVKRLFPKLIRYLPKDKKGDLMDGPVDALLIAGYGLRKLGSERENYLDFL